MVTEDYVSFETAKLLKEKGFNEPTNEFFDGQKGLSKEKKICGGIPDFGECCWNEDPFVRMGFPKFKTFAKPSIAQVMKWLREVQGLNIYALGAWKDVEVQYGDWEPAVVGYNWFVESLMDDTYSKMSIEPFLTYEQACEAAIKYCLENLI